MSIDRWVVVWRGPPGWTVVPDGSGAPPLGEVLVLAELLLVLVVVEVVRVVVVCARCRWAVAWLDVAV